MNVPTLEEIRKNLTDEDREFLARFPERRHRNAGVWTELFRRARSVYVAPPDHEAHARAVEWYMSAESAGCSTSHRDAVYEGARWVRDLPENTVEEQFIKERAYAWRRRAAVRALIEDWREATEEGA